MVYRSTSVKRKVRPVIINDVKSVMIMTWIVIFKALKQKHSPNNIATLHILVTILFTIQAIRNFYPILFQIFF